MMVTAIAASALFSKRNVRLSATNSTRRSLSGSLETFSHSWIVSRGWSRSWYPPKYTSALVKVFRSFNG